MLLNELVSIDLNKLSSSQKRELLNKAKNKCTYTNPKYVQTKNMGFATHNIPYQIFTYLLDEQNDMIHFFRGNLDWIEDLLEIKLKDERKSVPVKNKFEIKFTPRIYQKECVDHIIKGNFTQGYIIAVCGSGKTFMTMDLMQRLKQKTLVIVDTTLLMEQWKRDILQNTTIQSKDIGLYGAGKKQIGNTVTIALIQSLKKDAVKLKDEFGMVVLDEMHKCPAPTFTQTMNSLNSKYRFGLTATLKRKDGMHIVIPHVFGDQLYHITKENVRKSDKFIDSRCIIRPTSFYYLNETGKIMKRNRRLKAIIRSAMEKGKDELAEIYEGQLNRNFHYDQFLEQITNDRERNLLILKDIIREVELGNKCVVFSERVSHCIKLDNALNKRGIRSLTIIGGMREEIGVCDIYNHAKTLMIKNELDVIVGTPKCVNESMSIPQLTRAFVTCPSIKNKEKLQQQKGRIERYMDGKTSCTLYYYWDKNVEYYSDPKKALINMFGERKVRKMY